MCTSPPISIPPPVRPARSRPQRWLVAALVLGLLGLVAGTIAVLSRRDRAEQRSLTPTNAAESPHPSGSAATTIPGGAVTTAAEGTAAQGASNGFVVVSSGEIVSDSMVLIEGESRRLYMFAEVRNDGPATAHLGYATVTVRDASGAVMGTRSTRPFDQVLDPGEATFVGEITPSMTYWEGELNTFPEGWASWDLSLDVETPYTPETYDDVSLAIADVVTTPSTDGLAITGALTNSTPGAVASNVRVYAALLDGEGHLVNLEWTYVDTEDFSDLASGASLPFEVNFSDGPLDHASTVVGAIGAPAG